MNVYMDDTRIGPFNEQSYYGPTWDNWHNWVIVRGVKNVKVLLQLGVVDDLALDHDMGDRLPDGTDLVNWMIENDCFPKGHITIHSANLEAAKNMQSKLDSYRRVKESE